jgi:uncharacterized protein involved in exopolysaccharide biosynthesis
MNPGMTKPQAEDTPRTQFISQPPAQSSEFKLELARSIKMHRSATVIVCTIVFLSLVAFGLSRKPSFETEALIYVQPMKAKVITDPSGGTYDSSRYESYFQQQLQTITRPDILSEALAHLPLGVWQMPNESEQSAIARLQHSLKTERVAGSYELSVSLSGDNPAAIAKIVNAVIDAYIHKERVDELAQNDQQLQVLMTERERLQSDLDKAHQDQAALNASLGVAESGGTTINPYDPQLADLRTQLASARAAQLVAATQLASISSGTNTSEALNTAASEVIATDPGLIALKSSVSQRRGVITGQNAGLKPSNPVYKQNLDELARLDKTIDTSANELRQKAALQLQQKLKLEAARTTEIYLRLTRQLEQQTSIATKAVPNLQHASDVAETILRLQANYTAVDSAIRSIELEHNSTGLAHLSLAAAQPLSPKASKKIFILMLALPFSLLFGSIIAVVLHKMDPKVYIADDVNTAISFAPMAVLPSSEEVSSRVMDEFLLRLVAGVDYAYRSGDAKTFVFTSASESTNIGELIASLAIKMNQIGYRTMTLKASAALKNLAPTEIEPRRYWGTPGLTNSNESQLAQGRHESSVFENLRKLRQNVDLLFVEALPILSSAETEFVTRLGDITVLLAESGHTTGRELKNSLTLIKRLNSSGIAAILTDVRLRTADKEFVAAVRSVEGRQAEMKRSDSGSRTDVNPYSGVVFLEDAALASGDVKIPRSR